MRTGGTVALGLSWPTGAVWLRGELAAGFDERGPPVMRPSGSVVISVRP